IERYPVLPLRGWDRALGRCLAAWENRRRRQLEQRLLGGRCFGAGWLRGEPLGSSGLLWSEGDSLLHPPAGGALCVEAMAPEGGTLAWASASGLRGSRRLRAGCWEPLRLEAAPALELHFAGRRWRHAGRRLAFALREGRAWSGGAAQTLLGAGTDPERDPRAIVRDLVGCGERRSALEELGSRRHRGPDSPRLLARVAALLPAADAVVAGYFPFSLAADAQRLCSRARRPFLLLPFAHAADAGHHFRWQYRLVR